MPTIVPHLWFDTEAEQAAQFYASVFPSSRILGTTRYPEGAPGPTGSVMTVECELDGQRVPPSTARWWSRPVSGFGHPTTSWVVTTACTQRLGSCPDRPGVLRGGGSARGGPRVAGAAARPADLRAQALDTPLQVAGPSPGQGAGADLEGIGTTGPRPRSGAA